MHPTPPPDRPPHPFDPKYKPIEVYDPPLHYRPAGWPAICLGWAISAVCLTIGTCVRHPGDPAGGMLGGVLAATLIFGVITLLAATETFTGRLIAGWLGFATTLLAFLDAAGLGR